MFPSTNRWAYQSWTAFGGDQNWDSLVLNKDENIPKFNNIFLFKVYFSYILKL